MRIRTYKKAGKKTFYSAWSRVKAVKTTRADAAIAAEERIEYGIQAVEALDEAQIADEASALLVG